MTDNALLVWSWPDLVQFEPALVLLERFALNLHADPLDAHDWSTLVGMLREIAGPMARRPELRAEEPFAVSQEHLRRCWETGSAENAEEAKGESDG